jgi:hypothetical protein
VSIADLVSELQVSQSHVGAVIGIMLWIVFLVDNLIKEFIRNTTVLRYMKSESKLHAALCKMHIHFANCVMLEH